MRGIVHGICVLAAVAGSVSEASGKVIFRPVDSSGKPIQFFGGCNLQSAAQQPAAQVQITFALVTDGDTEQLTGLVEPNSFLDNSGIITYTAASGPSTQITLNANPALLANGSNKAYVAFFAGSAISPSGYVIIDLHCTPSPTITLTTDTVNVQTPAGSATVNVVLPSEINGASGLNTTTNPIGFTITPDTESSSVNWIASTSVPGSTPGSPSVYQGGTADLAISINPAGLAALATPYVGFLHIRDNSNTQGEADLTILLTITGSATGNAVLPHIAANGAYVTGLLVVNTGIYTGNYRINFLDDSGKPQMISVQGQGYVDHISGNLPSGNSFYAEAGDPALPTVGGSAQIVADPGIGVQALFRHQVTDATGTHYWEAGVPSSAGSFEFEIPFDFTVFAPTGEQTYTGIAIANVDSTNTATVNCTARDSSGTVVPSAIPQLTILPNGHYANYNFTPLIGKRGTLDCTSTTLIGVVALHTFIGGANSTLPVFLK